jgi:hypothetical protein
LREDTNDQWGAGVNAHEYAKAIAVIWDQGIEVPRADRSACVPDSVANKQVLQFRLLTN